jgi:hypothetical protein
VFWRTNLEVSQVWLSQAMARLTIARRAGALEAPMVIASFAQLAAVPQLNVRVFGAIES